MKLSSSLITATLGLVRTAAAIATYSPVVGGPSYSIGLPPGTTASATEPGTLYFSIEAPSKYQWVGLGIGSHMGDSTIFLLYPDGHGNVTFSARNGLGHVQPQLNSDLLEKITLLEGTGIADGVMRANVKCTACTLHSDSTATDSPWIAAWKSYGSLPSTDVSLMIRPHDPNSHRQFTFDLTAAKISQDANPFSSSPGPASMSAPGRGSGENSLFKRVPTYLKAHGVLMSVAIVLLFPFGAISMRLFGSPLVHGLIQVIALAALIAGFGIGIELAQLIGLLFKGEGVTHTVFGTVIVVLFLIQPFIGLLHHFLFARTGGRTPVSHVHIWLGRSIIICGVVNGGLGLQLANNSNGGEIALGVLAGIIAVVYAVIVVVKRKGSRKSIVVVDQVRTPWGKKAEDNSS